MPVEPGAHECPGCGIVFAKYYARADQGTAAPAAPTRPLRLVVPIRGVEWWLQIALLVALVGWTVSFATTR